MTRLTIIFSAVSLLTASICLIIVFSYRRKMKKILERMNAMLTSAISGRFSETLFDESLLSAVETKLSHYISSSAISAQSLREEKDKIMSLLGDISHQTKTPIANILLYAQLLEEQELNGESKVCVSAINAQAGKLRFLIDALVKTSRLETGVFQLNPVLSAVQPVLDAAVEGIAPGAGKKNIEVICTKTDASALMDAKWTGEALHNILDNAVKYTSDGGKIRITAVPYQFFCRIDIADTGIGIAENESEKIFQRFYRSPAVSNTEGIGIGLYLARQIVSAQGGYIKVLSSNGKGACFSVFLPMQS